jgi:hypothetical protein
MPLPDRGLLPRKSDLESLNDEQLKGIFAAVEAQGRRSFLYSMYGMTCGAVSFLASLAACVRLAGQGHESAAALVMGAAIVTTVGRMIQGRKAE